LAGGGVPRLEDLLNEEEKRRRKAPPSDVLEKTEVGPPVVQPLLLIPAGKIRCFVHPDVVRQDTPEEHVRQRAARSLVEE